MNWKTYIYKVLKQVHPDQGISKDAHNQLNAFINVLAEAISEQAYAMCDNENVKTVSAKHIQKATRVVLQGELAKHAVTEGTKAVTKKQSAIGSSAGSAAGKTRQSLAGLQFSVSRAETTLRGNTTYRIGNGAPYYLAAVLEYITAEILELSGNATRDNRLTRIKVRHIYLAIYNDEELKRLVEYLDFLFRGGGVISNIHQEFLADKKKKPLNRKWVGGVKPAHRFRPGTVALRHIRAQQKKTDLILNKGNFGRLVRASYMDVVDVESTRVEEAFLVNLQYVVEDVVINVLELAVDLAIHADRQRVNDKDIKLAVKNVAPYINITAGYDYNSKEYVYDGQYTYKGQSYQVANNPELERLGYRAGVKSKSGLYYGPLRTFIYRFITYVLQFVVHYNSTNNPRSVRYSALVLALKNIDIVLE